MAPALTAGQRRGLQPHRQGGQGQGQSLQLRTAGGLGAAAAVHKQGALGPLSPPVPPPSPHKTPDDSDDGVQLRSSDLLSPLDGPKTCCWCWKVGGGGWRGDR